MASTDYPDLSQGCFPRAMRFIAEKMENFNRNTFKLQTQGADTARAFSIVTVNLPESALLHMPSFRMFMTATCSAPGVAGIGTDIVFAKLGNYSSLISKVEVYLNGVQLQNGSQEYATIVRILKLGRSTQERDTSVDRCLMNSMINNVASNDVKSICINNWYGVLNETSAEYIPTELLGSIQVRLTFSGNEVLVPKQTGQNVGVDLTTASAIANAGTMTYAISNLSFSINSVVPDMCYNMLLRQQLEQEGIININYREYYTYTLDSITSGTSTVRFSLSSGSIDRVYTVYRDASYQTIGKPGWTLPDAVLTGTYVSNYLRFRSYDSATVNGTQRSFYTINNVQYPQYEKQTIEGVADLAYVCNKLSDTIGNLVTSLDSYNDGSYVNPLLLSCPTELGCGLKSGYSSKGVNTQMTASVKAQVIPAAASGTPSQSNTGSISAFVLLEVTQSIVVGVGKQVAISY